MKMAQEETISTCLICKHDLVFKINIFKMRTGTSKTLLSSKLSKIVQDVFSPERMDSQDICTSCSALLNDLDECECKMMALENEVKLKYKVPFAIEVDNRSPSQRPPPPPEVPAVGLPGSIGPLDGHQPVQQPAQVISITDAAGGVGTTAITIQSAHLGDDGNLVIFRESTESVEPTSAAGQTLSMPDLHVLGTSGSADGGDGRPGSDVPSNSEQDPEPAPKKKKGRRRASRPNSSDGPGDLRAGGVTCQLCDEKLDRVSDLKAHLMTHDSDKKLDCGFCPRLFTNHMLLHRHWNLEHPMQLLPCPRCERRFVTRSCLRKHMLIHEDPRFSCEHCGRPFHTQGDLRKHCLIRHSDLKNFPCPHCPAKFKLNWMLRRHRVSVHDQKT